MAACSSGVPELAVSSTITETRYCISDHPCSPGAPLVGGLSPLLRTPLPRSDTGPPDFFSRLSGTPVVNDRPVEAIAGHLRRPWARHPCHALQPVAYCGRPAGR